MPVRGYRKGRSDQKVPLPRFVRTRLSDNEFSLLVAEAESRSVGIARLTRSVLAAHLSGKRVELPHRRGMTNDALRQLARIGNNLNQLARQANHGIVPIEAEELRACLERLNELARSL